MATLTGAGTGTTSAFTQVFANFPGRTVYLPQGRHSLTIYFDTASINLGYLEFTPSSSVDRSALAHVVAQAEALVTGEYSSESWDLVAAALARAIDALGDAAASQAELDDAETDLAAKIEQLSAAVKDPPEATELPTVSFSDGTLGLWSYPPDHLT